MSSAPPRANRLNSQGEQKTEIDSSCYLFRKQPSAAPNKTFGQVSGLISRFFLIHHLPISLIQWYLTYL